MHPLDNVIWKALTTRQAHFAQGAGSARKFAADIGPLAGFEDGGSEGYASLAPLLGERDIGAIFLNRRYEPRDNWECLAEAPLLQMVQSTSCHSDRREESASSRQGHTAFAPLSDSSLERVELGKRDSAEMIALTELTKPGPFGPRTHELGTYLGIRNEGKLVAMAGERLKVPGYTEVSAVCTHPDHLGRGYAAALMTEIMRRIRERGETPFLHVREDNARAIALYERLGFRIRWAGHFAVLRKPKTKRDVASNASSESV